MSNTDAKVEATKSSLLTGQLIAAIWIILGTVGIWLVNPLYGWLFLAFSALSVYVIVRRFLCNSCYYCKSCTKGFAKLSILFLGANRIPGLSKGSILSMTTYIYIVLTVIPALILTNSALQQFSLINTSVLACLLVVSIYGIASRLKKGDKIVIS